MDILIKNGLVFDGTGAEPVRADVGISGDRIADVGDLSGAEAGVVLDATGRCVCPGFIDAHSHSDTYLLIEPSSPSKTFQGITTEVVGNCGASAAPRAGDYTLPSDWQEQGYPGTWKSVAEYRSLLEKVQPAPNVVFLAGHKALRVGVTGHALREVTSDELARMQDLLRQALDEGARGLSSGLIYAPATSATTEELCGLAGVVADRGGIYTSHMRSEGRGLLEAIDETLEIGRKTGVRVEISHLKASGKGNWGLLDEALEQVRRARSEGQPVAADRYPYTSACTELDVIFPDWVLEGGKAAGLARLADPVQRERLKDELVASRAGDYWATVTVGSAWDPSYAEFQGMPLPQVATQLDMDPVDAAIRLVEVGAFKTSAFFHGMSEENMMRVLAEPYVMLGTDASLRSPEGPLSRDYPHPRAYGSFPKFLRLALDGKTVPVAEAIRKMTSLAADHFQLRDRGRLARGSMADLVVFDPERMADRSQFSNPHCLAEGIDAVLVNGTVTLRDRRLTGDRAGRWL